MDADLASFIRQHLFDQIHSSTSREYSISLISFGQRKIKRLQYRLDCVNFKEASFVKISRVKYACEIANGRKGNSLFVI